MILILTDMIVQMSWNMQSLLVCEGLKRGYYFNFMNFSHDIPIFFDLKLFFFF